MRSTLTQPEVALRSLVGYAILLRALLGIILRLRIYFAAPLKPQAPVLWMTVGVLEGVAVSSLIGILCILAGGKHRTNWARAVLLSAFVFLAALYLAVSEAIAYLGHGLHPESFALSLHPRFFSGSGEGDTVIRDVILLSLFLVSLGLASRRASRASSTGVTLPRLFALVVPGVLALMAAPYVHLSETSSSVLVQMAQLYRERRRIEQLHSLIAVPKSRIPLTSIRKLMPVRHRTFLDDRYPLAYLPPPRSAAAVRLPPGVRPNIVVILMESLRSAEVGAYGGDVPGLTPNFDWLARNGIRVDDAYSVGGYTPEGELGIWYGLLASPYEIVIRNRAASPLSGLPEFLRDRGYQLLWSHPGDQTLYLSSRFYHRRGFHVSDGGSFAPDEPRTNWGFSDKALARHTISLLDRVREPFAAMELTISNHHPFQLPPDASPFRLRLRMASRRSSSATIA